MGTIVDIGDWRRRNQPEATRLEEAVARLDQALAGRYRERAPEWLVTEAMAIVGAMAMDQLDEAADRAERLADRLATRGFRRGRAARAGHRRRGQLPSAL